MINLKFLQSGNIGLGLQVSLFSRFLFTFLAKYPHLLKKKKNHAAA